METLPASRPGRNRDGEADTAGIPSQLALRPAVDADLGAVNAVVERAVMTWKLPERVKRLAMQSYFCTACDLKCQQVVIAGDSAGGVVGVAAWEAAAARDCPQGRRGLLLHGIYVEPARQRHGIGARLLSAAALAMRAVSDVPGARPRQRRSRCCRTGAAHAWHARSRRS